MVRTSRPGSNCQRSSASWEKQSRESSGCCRLFSQGSTRFTVASEIQEGCGGAQPGWGVGWCWNGRRWRQSSARSSKQSGEALGSEAGRPAGRRHSTTATSARMTKAPRRSGTGTGGLGVVGPAVGAIPEQSAMPKFVSSAQHAARAGLRWTGNAFSTSQICTVRTDTLKNLRFLPGFEAIHCFGLAEQRICDPTQAEPKVAHRGLDRAHEVANNAAGSSLSPWERMQSRKDRQFPVKDTFLLGVKRRSKTSAHLAIVAGAVAGGVGEEMGEAGEHGVIGAGVRRNERESRWPRRGRRHRGWDRSRCGGRDRRRRSRAGASGRWRRDRCGRAIFSNSSSGMLAGCQWRAKRSSRRAPSTSSMIWLGPTKSQATLVPERLLISRGRGNGGGDGRTHGRRFRLRDG